MANNKKKQDKGAEASADASNDNAPELTPEQLAENSELAKAALEETRTELFGAQDELAKAREEVASTKEELEAAKAELAELEAKKASAAEIDAADKRAKEALRASTNARRRATHIFMSSNRKLDVATAEKKSQADAVSNYRKMVKSKGVARRRRKGGRNRNAALLRVDKIAASSAVAKATKANPKQEAEATG